MGPVSGGVSGVNSINTSLSGFVVDLRQGVSGESKVPSVLPGDEAVDTVPVVNDNEGVRQSTAGAKLRFIPADDNKAAPVSRVGYFKSNEACSVSVLNVHGDSGCLSLRGRRFFSSPCNVWWSVPLLFTRTL